MGDRVPIAIGLPMTLALRRTSPQPAVASVQLRESRKTPSISSIGLAFFRRGNSFKTALTSLRKGGALTLVGNLSPTLEFPLQVAVTREITVYGSCASAGEYPACLQMIARGAIEVDSLISAAAPLREGAEWFERLYRREPGLMKVILQPGV